MSPPPSDQSVEPASPVVVSLAGWLLPGAGFWMLGQRARAVTIGVTILALVLLGILIGGIRVMEAPPGPTRIMDKPFFICQIMLGPVDIATAWLASVAARLWPETISHSRSAEIGTLYTAVAGLLNLLAIIDSAFRAARPAPARGAGQRGEGPWR